MSQPPAPTNGAPPPEPPPAPRPRLIGLHVKNYRVLRDVRIDGLTPLTAFVGANGSGKSTIMDVFSFLAECLRQGVTPAVESRGGLGELRSRGSEGSITIAITYREQQDPRNLTYRVTIKESAQDQYSAEEDLRWEGAAYPQFSYGEGGALAWKDDEPGWLGRERWVVPDQELMGLGAGDDLASAIDPLFLARRDELALSAYSRFAGYARLTRLVDFLTDFYLPQIDVGRVRSGAPHGSRSRLSPSGDNLAAVVAVLQARYPAHWRDILNRLQAWVPQLAGVATTEVGFGSVGLQVADRPFETPIPAQFVSDGTLKLLAYLTILYGPDPPALIGLEEPEAFVPPRLVQELAEVCRTTPEATQILVTTHSPFFIDGLRPEEVWSLHRAADGYTQARRASDIQGVTDFMEAGAQLGDLWTEGYFRIPQPAGSRAAGA